MSLPAFTRTASDIVAEVLMTRSAFSGPIVLVEGSPDSRFLKRHLLSIAQLTMCGGKQTAIVAMTNMATMGIQGCIAIVDRDFDDHRAANPPANVYYTDTHDTETLLLASRLDTVLHELGDEAKLRAYKAVNGDMAGSVLDRAEKFGRLRYLNEVAPAFYIGMGPFSPWKYIDQGTWMVDEPRLNTDFATSCGHPTAHVLALIGGLPPLNTWKDAQGHDTLAIISIGLRQVLGNGTQAGEPVLSSSLRLAFTEDDFRQTQLYADLRIWEQASGMNVLAH